MIRLGPEVLEVIPRLNERQQRVVRMRLDGSTCTCIARTLQMPINAVSLALRRAQTLTFANTDVPRLPMSFERRKRPAHHGKPIDAALYARQVDYVRSLAHDEEHCEAYLRGIAMVQGQAVADEVERRAKG